MARFEGQAGETRLNSPDSQADPIGDPCPVCGSLWSQSATCVKSSGTVQSRDRGGASNSGASVVGERIADRVGEIIARHRRKHAQIRLEIESRDTHSLGP